MTSLSLATLTATERLARIPAHFWWSVLIAVALIVLAVTALRAISKINQVILAVAVIMFVGGLCTHWIHERDEPAWARPAVAVAAAFFPAKPAPAQR